MEAPLLENLGISTIRIAHRYCVTCYPFVFPGMFSLCGWRCQGIIPTGNYDICIVCDDLQDAHAKEHK